MARLLLFGGKGGVGATAGNVTINNSGASITTTKDQSSAIVAQSIGGSGGSGGSALTVSISLSGGTPVGAQATVGGTGGSGGTAGNVEVTNSGNISTGSLVVEEFQGNDGDVSITYLEGIYSHGIFAQSVGGGGGSGGNGKVILRFSNKLSGSVSPGSNSIGTDGSDNVAVFNVGGTLTTS